MGKKTKVRFYARVTNGESVVNAQLISVRQQPSGDLVITLRPNRYFEIHEPVRVNVPLLEHRYTVHVSPQSQGYTLTGTYVLESQVRKLAQFIACNGRPLVACLFSKRWPELAYDHFRMRNTDRDTLKKVADYDQRVNNLVTHVIVTSKGLGELVSFETEGSPWHRFDHFDLVVVPHFIKWNSILQSDSLHPQSSDHHVDGDVGEGQFEDVQTMPRGAVWPFCWSQAELLTAMLEKRYEDSEPPVLELLITRSRVTGLLSIAAVPFEYPPEFDREVDR